VGTLLEKSSFVGPRVERLLDHARTHLAMEVAYLSDFIDGQEHIVAASGDLSTIGGLAVGDSRPLADSYSARVISGTLPAVIAETKRDPATRDLPVTEALGVGSYVGAPVRDSGGEAVGMLCCVSRNPTPLLDADAGQFLRLVVSLMADDLPDWVQVADDNREDWRARTERLLEERSLRSVFQAVLSLTENRVIGYEALCRFDGDPAGNPADLFLGAAVAGLGAELELLALQTALRHLNSVPDGAWMSVNVSPVALIDRRVRALLARHGRRLVVEITEHFQVSDYDELTRVTRDLQDNGVRIAIDDAGAGYASLRHILKLQPDIIKLDMQITRDIHRDPAKQALAGSLTSFADSFGALLVAEGVETKEELAALTGLGVDAAQGFLIARPGPLDVEVYLPHNPQRRPDMDTCLDALLNAAETGGEAMERAAIEAVLRATNLQTAVLTRYRDPENPKVATDVLRTTSSPDLPDELSMTWSAGLADRCLAHDINWTSDLPAVLPDLNEQDRDVQTFLCLPLRGQDGSVNGTLCAGSSQRCTISSDVRTLLRAYARLLSDSRVSAASVAIAANV
jgi:EAL domain-containing protein (putative c-di-GMP-specific phosphodiesterase class I)